MDLLHPLVARLSIDTPRLGPSYVLAAILGGCAHTPGLSFWRNDVNNCRLQLYSAANKLQKRRR